MKRVLIGCASRRNSFLVLFGRGGLASFLAKSSAEEANSHNYEEGGVELALGQSEDHGGVWDPILLHEDAANGVEKKEKPSEHAEGEFGVTEAQG